MPEYVEREAVIERLTNLMQLQAPTARAIIEAIPAADVRPVVHEKWKPFNFHAVACSGCGFKVDIMEVPNYILNHLYHCPNCGADMRREEVKRDGPGSADHC